MNNPSPPTDSKEPSDSPTERQSEQQEEEEDRAGISGLQVVQSTLAAALGVQSSKNRKRDFAQARASQFIVAGILFTAIFVGAMVLLVRTILSSG